jgi:type IV pilus assembly protein PilB
VEANTTAAAAAVADDEYPRGLIPPIQRGRSHQMIGDVIVELGYVSREAVNQAVATARECCRPTGQILVESGEMPQSQLARALGERLGIDYIDLSIFEIDMGAANLVSVELAKRYRAVPVGFMPNRGLVLAMANPTKIMTIDEVSMITGMDVWPAVAADADIAAVIRRLSRLEDTVAEIEEPEPEITLHELADDAPTVKLVHSIVARPSSRGPPTSTGTPNPMTCRSCSASMFAWSRSR